MKIALLPYGSRGDFQPVLAVADALKTRGHDVRMTVNVSSEAWVRASGLEVVAMLPDVEAFWKRPSGQRMLASGQTLRFLGELSALEREHGEDLNRGCAQACQEADMIVSTVGTIYQGSSLAEQLGLPHATLTAAPIMRTASFASYLAPVRDLRLPQLNRWSWDLLYAAYWHGHKPILNSMRRAWGLAEWKARPHTEDGALINLFSRHLVPCAADAPANHVQVGQPVLSPDLRRRLGEAALPADLEVWLEAGPPPVFFGFGSMPVFDPNALVRDVEHLCSAFSIRALIGAGWSEIAQDRRSDSVFVAGAFDHDRVLPRCRAAVHHGGAGTTQSALRAGLPTLICSLIGDQSFWGWRVQRLGVGTHLRFQDMNRARLSDALETLLQPQVTARAQELGARLRSENGAEVAADAIERIASER